MEEYRVTNRGGIGIKNYMVTEKTGSVVGIKVVDGSEDLLLVTQSGILIRTPVDNIRTAGRATQGVIVMRFKEEGDQVISLALTDREETAGRWVRSASGARSMCESCRSRWTGTPRHSGSWTRPFRRKTGPPSWWSCKKRAAGRGKSALSRHFGSAEGGRQALSAGAIGHTDLATSGAIRWVRLPIYDNARYSYRGIITICIDDRTPIPRGWVRGSKNLLPTGGKMARKSRDG